MKNRILKIDTPCQEKWANMKPNDKGSYCNICSKNVIDFTQLNQVEISETLKKSGNSICGRLTQTQLNEPLLDLSNSFELTIPKSKVAAGLALATSLTLGHTAHAEIHTAKTEFVQSSISTSNSKKEAPISASSEQKLESVTIFTGKVFAQDVELPVENAKITFVTSQIVLSVYTSKDGTFSIEIPTDLIDDDNVIRVSYPDIQEERDSEMFFGYETKDYILSKVELASEYSIEAEPVILYLGGISAYSKKRKPIVLSNGAEIDFREFVKARSGEDSSCSLENKKYLYFNSEFAIAIYGRKAKDGLYILTEK